ncbi:glycoside hydrolase family 3 C-terminal domain-containing protein [Kutzneria chonburiensis]|uniref:glycoside hydrolase family 3 C-terminal domain-containing protein n=1 Tax=Kutzneria chonburiensis TaxID=1483604 RepID=UPI0023630D0C|nr:glycoside hydrolase family 3 C-terminal domain-containing protein [Kutzneria chonburiensis]
MSPADKIELFGPAQPAVPRLRLPETDFTVHAVTEDVSTVFPPPLGLGSSWNPHLAFQVGAAVADEIRAAGAGPVREMPAPVPLEDPRLGRNEHRYAEDPLLCAKLAALHTAGLRGPDDEQLRTAPVMWWGENADTNPRESFNLRLTHEHQLTVYRACFELGGAVGAVLSLERFGRAPAMAAFLVSEVVRTWSGDNAVVWFEAKTPPARGAAVQTLRMDVDGFLGPWDVRAELAEGHRVGTVPNQRLSLAARRILTLRQRLGPGDETRVDRRAHRRLARQAARESIVLLRNDGLLPLLTSPGLRVAVLGPQGAELVEELEKRVDVVRHGTGADRVRLTAADTDVRLDIELEMTEWQPGRFTLQAGDLHMTAELQPDGTLLAGDVSAGVYLTMDRSDHGISTTTDRSRATPLRWETIVDGAAHAAELARNVDIVVLAVGDNPAADDNRGRLRKSMALPAQQHRLIREVRAANANSVLAVLSPQPYALAWEDDYVPAILWSVPSGRTTSAALVEILFGEQAPSGRLPQTWYRSDEDVTAEPDRDAVAGGWTYMYTDSKPLYPFGHGLTYTTFEYGQPRLSGTTLTDDQEIVISVPVRNTGFRECAEVVQLYTRQLDSAVPQPHKQLRDFQKITLAPQSSRTVHFLLRASDLAFWDVVDQRWVVETGTHEVCVGRSSDDFVGTATITVHGTTLRGRKLAEGGVRASTADLSAGVVVVDTDDRACPVMWPTRPGAWLGFLRCDTTGVRSWGWSRPTSATSPSLCTCTPTPWTAPCSPPSRSSRTHGPR